MGKKWAGLVNLSTITYMALYLVDVLGKLITKSIEMLSHFHSRISNGCNFPNGLWCSIFIFWQIKHLFTKLATSDVMPGHQNIFLRSWYILLMPGCTVNSLLWASSKILSQRLSPSSTHIFPWYCHIHSLSWANLSISLITPGLVYAGSWYLVAAPAKFVPWNR